MKNILILVPTKNSWLYLPRLVDSLKKQTDANFRVIFVDSNSCSKHKKYLLEIKKKDPRFIFYNQNDNYKGIYGAMNNGIEYAKKNEWILFWGSDDYAYSKNTIKFIRSVVNKLKEDENTNMIIFKGRFVDHKTGKTKSKKHFSHFSDSEINRSEYKKLLFNGFRQAHQATLINPWEITKKYDEKYSLAADLDFYLKTTKLPHTKIKFCNKNIVNIGIGGVSRQKHILRTYEVFSIYLKSFKFLFFFPLLKRYLRFYDN